MHSFKDQTDWTKSHHKNKQPRLEMARVMLTDLRTIELDILLFLLF